MVSKTVYNTNQLRDYSSLFSRNEVLHWFKKDFRSINYKIKRYDEGWINANNTTYLDYLRFVYSVLEHHYQNEYIFKNTFLNDWLIKEMGVQNSKIFNEFRVGNSVADLVMFNGCSKLFEIKTEYDSDSRLALQLENYRKAFNQIFIIVPESRLKVYEKYDNSIGIITFNSELTDRFQLYRESSFSLEIEYDTIMQILHTAEYKAIVKTFYGELPDMTSFNQFQICSNLISKIPKSELNTQFISQLKSRENKNEFSKRYFKEFNQLSLALRMTKKERDIMIQNLKTPLQY